jgi:hypothetical protein
MMSFARKLSIVTLLGLSTVMIICALIRLVGSLTDTAETENGTTPVWATYWFLVESCVSLIMVSVIVIRGVFITNPVDGDERRKTQDSIFQHFSRRILSILRLDRLSKSSRRSDQRSDLPLHDQCKDPSAPRFATQRLPGGTLTTVKTFIWGGQRHGHTQDHGRLSVDTTYGVEDLCYHKIRKAEGTKHKP